MKFFTVLSELKDTRLLKSKLDSAVQTDFLETKPVTVTNSEPHQRFLLKANET